MNAADKRDSRPSAQRSGDALGRFLPATSTRRHAEAIKG